MKTPHMIKSFKTGRSFILALAILSCLIIPAACGVILDEVKLKDTWKLQRVEYYEYLPAFGTYKQHSIEPGDDISDGVPFFGAFFDNTDDGASLKEYYILKLQADDFYIHRIYTNSAGTVITETEVDQSKATWSIDTTANTITFDVRQTLDATDDVWQLGFSAVNDWPLADNDTLEIHIKASDIGKDYIRVPAKDGTSYKRIGIDSMKGIWTRSN